MDTKKSNNMFRIKKSRLNKIARLSISYAILIAVAVIIIYPLIAIVGASVTPGNFATQELFPSEPTLDHFRELFSQGKIRSNFMGIKYEAGEVIVWLLNTLEIGILNALFSTFLITLSGYVYSRFKFKNKQSSMMWLMILQMIPTFTALVAVTTLASLLGLYNSKLFLVLIYSAGFIPMNLFLMKGYFDSISISLDEAAKIDGASYGTILTKILIPLARPMLAIVLLRSFMLPLGDYILASTILRSDYATTLAVGLRQYIASQGAPDYSFTTFAAGSVLITVPIVILYMSLQKHLLGGLTAGGTKE